MKKFALPILIAVFALAAFAQKPRSTPAKSPRPTPKPAKTVIPQLGTETEEFEKAKAVADAAERIKALQTFLTNFPEGVEVRRAKGLIVSARAVLAEERLNANDVTGAVALFTEAINETPEPVPDELFTKVVLGFPFSLKARNQLGPAFDVAKLVEARVGANASQILDLAKFFISAQYGTEAIRLAEKSIALDSTSEFAFQTAAIAYRMNFRLEDSAVALAKALEINPASTASRQNLAEMKRALGKYDEALALYRETLVLDPENAGARNGLILALFESGKRAEAEIELKSTLETNSSNPSLLTGVAYWYATSGDAEKAGLYAKMALAIDQTSIWAYVAEARGLMIDKKPLEAERVLLNARQFGDLPTLDFELATARMAAGFYREAAETLKRNFVVNQDGLIETYLGNRVLADAQSFTELLSLERRALIYNREAADNPESTRRLKALLDLYQKLEKDETAEADLTKAVDEFVSGSDAGRLHRQLFTANRLLQKKKALPKVAEILQAAVSGVDNALSVPNPTAAVLADELYDSRQYFIARSQVVSINELPKQKLSAILRGRIEELAGWAFINQDNSAQAIIRFKRALTVLPEKSAWWRSTWKRLGSAYIAEGKEPEALDAFIKSYDRDQPNKEERTYIADLWIKVNGKIDGLDGRIGPDPFAPTVAQVEPTPEAVKLPQDLPLASPTATPEVTPSPTQVTVEATPTPEMTPNPSPSPELTPSPSPETVEATPTPTPESSPAPKPLFDPIIIVVGKTPEKSPTPSPEPTPESTPTPTPDPTPTPKEAEPTPEPTVEPTPTPDKTPVPSDETVAANTQTPTPDQNGETRPRVVTQEPCTIVLSQENLSIVAGGGNIGILVGFDDDRNDPAQIKAVSNSPQDVEATADPAIGFSSRRVFFAIRSKSEKTGVFTISFEAACGKKEAQIRVR